MGSIQTIRVTSSTGSDPLGHEVLVEVRRALGLRALRRIRTVKVYRLEGVREEEARRLATSVLAETVDQIWSLGAPLVTDADRVLEVGYRPGVMNPESASILKAARDLGIQPIAADSSREYAFYGELADAELDRIVHRLLVNPTVERVVTEEPQTLVLAGTAGISRRVAISAMDDEALMALSDNGLYLDVAEMKAIRDHFSRLGREPTDLELEVLAQTWSEHCVHKTFRSPMVVDGQAKPPLMTRLKEASAGYAELVLSAFEDNSGVMDFYDGWAVAGKVETHNSPSAIEPYGGAMTGSGGVFRDILGTGKGATVIASTDMFCFAPPDTPNDEVPQGALRPDYLLRRVVAGVRDYGNRMGIPTNNGSVRFHPGFRAKPTIIVGSYGLMPASCARKGHPLSGDRILVLGGRTGRDGIHGATFSSTAMTHQTIEVNAQAVQIGNPIEEKRMLDAVLACRDRGLIRAITDCGAGGFSSAVGEMAKGLGAEVHLERAPLKYHGLAPWEIFVSESQERMVMAVEPSDVPGVEAICATYNVEVTDLGSFEATGRLLVLYDGTTVGDLDMHFLHDGWPAKTMAASWSPREVGDELGEGPAGEEGWRNLGLRMMAHPTIASKEPIVRQYDHTVQGMCALPPFGGPTGKAANDAVVLAPLLGSPYGVIIAHGLNPALNLLDPYWGGVWAAVEAMANYVAVGGDPGQASLIDNFIWPSPDAPSLGELDRAVDACVAVMHAFRRPFISGKDSLSSTYRFPDGRSLKIPPVLCISVFGRIADVRRTTSCDFKRAGSSIVAVGNFDPGRMGGSVYAEILGRSGGRPPQVPLDGAVRTLAAVHRAIHDGHVLACHDISEGGLFVALAEMAIGGVMGAEVDVASLADRPQGALFSECAGAFLVELDDASAAPALFAHVPHAVIGRTIEPTELRIAHHGSGLMAISVADLQEAWERPLGTVFH